METDYNLENLPQRQVVLTWADTRYPDKLRFLPQLSIDNLDYPTNPYYLFTVGENRLNDPRANFVSVIGSSHPNDFDLENAGLIGNSLAKNGFSVVSGNAMGVDSAALLGCIQSGGYAVAVLAGGMDNVTGNKEAAVRIANAGGLLVAEHSLARTVQKKNYLLRNRITAALSERVVVVGGQVSRGTHKATRVAYALRRKIGVCYSSNPARRSELSTYLIEEIKNKGLDSEGLIIPLQSTEQMLDFAAGQLG